MKRDMDLIRLLLEKVETDQDLESEDYTLEQVLYHLVLMEEAGLIVASFVRSGMGQVIGADTERLTNAGHDFLETARNKTVWNKFKTTVAKAGGGVTIDLAKELLTKLAKDHFLGSSEA